MLNLIILWILIRMLTSLFAGAVSSLRPFTPIELATPFYPPSIPIATWLERVFLSPWMRWDAEWYQKVVTSGYSASDGTLIFHPLFPWLATPIAKIGISPLLSLLIVSSLAGIALFYCFYKLARMDLETGDAFFAILLFALSPAAFIFFAPYPEALFLLLAVLCLFFARKKSWWLSALMGGLAVLTRQQGIFLLLPVGWELWENDKRNIKTIILHWKNWVSLLLIPMGYLLWIFYRAQYTNGLRVNFTSVHQFIYSFFISPSASEVVEQQQFLWPWQSVYLSLEKLITEPDLDIWINLIAGLVFIVMLGISWRKMRMSYRIYCLLIALVSFSYYTGPVHPYMGLPRHLLLAFPIYIGAPLVITRPWMRLLVVALSAAGMTFLLGMYVLHTWVP
jgi:Gpi18-like mannosyltransferase